MDVTVHFDVLFNDFQISFEAGVMVKRIGFGDLCCEEHGHICLVIKPCLSESVKDMNSSGCHYFK